MASGHSTGTQRAIPGLFNGMTPRRDIIQQERAEKKQQSYLERRMQNRFAGLSSNVNLSNYERDNEAETKIQMNHKPASYKQPPIVVHTRHSFTDVMKLCDMKCVFKRTSIGTKIMTDDKINYDLCKRKLESAKFEFHSYESNDDKLLKVYLYGLSKMGTEDIVNELKDHNIVPESVEEVITKRSSIEDAIYAVKFKKSSVNLGLLKKVRFLCRTSVQWKPFIRRNKGQPTQCWNCLMYGHGGNNCFRKSACGTCGSESHNAKNCPLIAKNQETIVAKCFNCIKRGWNEMPIGIHRNQSYGNKEKSG